MNDTDWLEANKSLRMDANTDLFDKERREFHLSRYQFAKQFCKGKYVLDGACGTGYGAQILGEVAANVVGIDCSSEAVCYARKMYSNDRVSFKEAFVERSSFHDEQFDVVVSFETVEHTLSPNSHAQEIARVLKIDGTAIVSVPNKWGMTDHHFWDFNVELLTSIFSKFFGKMEFYYNNSCNREGRKKGIGRLNYENEHSAECIVAVLSDVKKDKLGHESVMTEIYTAVFARHQMYLDQERELNIHKDENIGKVLGMLFRIAKRFCCRLFNRKKSV